MPLSPKSVAIKVNTYPHPRQFTFALMIDGRFPIPEDGILGTTWNMGDGTILDDFDLEVDYTYRSSGAYAVAVDVTFEGAGKEAQDAKSLATESGNIVATISAITNISVD